MCISFFTHVFTTHYIFKKPAKNNGANTRKKCVKLYNHQGLDRPWSVILDVLETWKPWEWASRQTRIGGRNDGCSSGWVFADALMHNRIVSSAEPPLPCTECIDRALIVSRRNHCCIEYRQWQRCGHFYSFWTKGLGFYVAKNWAKKWNIVIEWMKNLFVITLFNNTRESHRLHWA